MVYYSALNGRAWPRAWSQTGHRVLQGRIVRMCENKKTINIRIPECVINASVQRKKQSSAQHFTIYIQSFML